MTTKVLKFPFGWAEEADELWVNEIGTVSLMIRDFWGDLTEEMTSRNTFLPQEIEEVLLGTAVFEETACPIVMI